MPVIPADLARDLGNLRLDLSHEKAAQAELQEQLLALLPITSTMEREYRLSARDIPDFLIDRSIAIELKVKGAPRAMILAQLERYAKHPEVAALILLSNVSMRLPPLIGGKPAFFVSLGGAWL